MSKKIQDLIEVEQNQTEEEIVSTPATRVAQTMFDHVADLGDQLWTAILDQVPPAVAELLNAHDELMTTLGALGPELLSTGRGFTQKDFAELHRIEHIAVTMLAG